MTRAAILEEIGAPLIVAEVELDEPGPGELVIDVRASGLCHSDLSYADRDFGQRVPLLLGHEVAGVVSRVGPDVRDIGPGDHVVTCLSGHCGRCSMCVQGRTWLCANVRELGRRRGAPPRITRDGAPVTQSAHLGGWATSVLVSELATVVVPPEVPFASAALLGCCVVTGLGAATKAASLAAGERVVVIGCGGVGLNVVQGARLAGAGLVVAVDLDADKLALASSFGADHVVDANSGDAVAAVRELTSGGADHAFEVVGSPVTAEQAVAMTAPAGHAYLLGVAAPGTRYAFDAGDLIVHAKSVHGVLMGATQFRLDIPRYADLYLRGRIELDALVGTRLGLHEINDGLEAMRSGSAAARSVVVFD